MTRDVPMRKGSEVEIDTSLLIVPRAGSWGPTSLPGPSPTRRLPSSLDRNEQHAIAPDARWDRVCKLEPLDRATPLGAEGHAVSLRNICAVIFRNDSSSRSNPHCSIAHFTGESSVSLSTKRLRARRLSAA